MLTHIDQLEQHSTWRKYLRNIDRLKQQGAPPEVIELFTLRAARESFLVFAYVMTDGQLLVEPFHELIGSIFEDLAYRYYHRAIISCPPRSGKSFLSGLFLAWLIGRRDSSEHILASYGQSLSNKLFSGCSNYLNHPKFGTIFPEWGGFAENKKREFANRGRVLVTSVGGALTGFTAGTLQLYENEKDWGVGSLIVDDPLKGSHSPAAFKELETWWGEQASTRRTNNWCQVVIATRFSVHDLHGLLMKTDGLYHPEENPLGWRWLNIQAICENEATDPLGRKNGQSHWPTNPIFTIEMLEQQKSVMGSNGFSALYQGSPIAGEGSLVKPQYLSFEDEITHHNAERVWLALDTAFSEKESADDSVITIMGCNPSINDFVDVYEMIYGKFDFPKLLALTIDLAKYYRTNTIAIENKASGMSLIQMLKQQTQLNVQPMKADRSKSTRLQMALPLFEANRVRFKTGAWNEQFRDQILTFPFALHDDMVDSLVHGLLYYIENYDNLRRDLTKCTDRAAANLNHIIKEYNNPLSSNVGYNRDRPKTILPGRRARLGSRSDLWT